ncbi:replication restart DNA helicase PriA [Prosthecobacter fusiformis]|uniref:Replication restart protein PriA n=1 Tax=Prosthecobacter fusiformis TaxID=48464 RepID=A0A4R7RLP6_9BACT|nr:primosomal protein N' [Prosthecobacter fusiformis]TDU63074.1 replication restart DNA helicase PriA [Prosthecobacter fusiformis]
MSDRPANSTPPAAQSLFDLGMPSAEGEHSPALAEGQRIARVQIETAAALELDYVIPEKLERHIGIGTRVMVPLQNQRVAAVVIELLESSSYNARLKEIASLVGTRPMFTPGLLKLAHWISDYYVVPVNRVLRTMLPQAVREKPETFLTDSHLKLAKEPPPDIFEKMHANAPMQARILEKLRSNGGEATLSELRRELPRATAIIKPLLKAGWITRSEVRVERDPFQTEEFLPSQPLTLTEEQQVAYVAVMKAIHREAGTAASVGESVEAGKIAAIAGQAERSTSEQRPPSTLLLHGVTGSGKTEVYLQAIAQVLDMGKTALVLVPEISLTPQTIERFKARFSEKSDAIAVLHSHLSDGERHDEWFKVHEGRAKIVIGARSAIFAPLENMGLIIVDEEHEPSYKQEDAPRYHARDVAVVRGRIEHCAVLLGSATPSLESFQNATLGKYELLNMTRRTDGKSMPLIRIVDMRLERRKGTEVSFTNTGILSQRLRMAIQDRLTKKEQTILFLNRRGFNTSLSCVACGETVQCQECAIPMTLHKKDNRLVCHICGARRVPPSKCPSCKEPGLKYAGFGTERVEQAVREVFPQARMARVDTDTMQRKNQLRDTLKDFRAQKLDILIGTQMIAKGLDFPNVTLVGVLNADTALNIPDFRAAERTFQLLVQVAGRSGRGEVKGEVFVQTHAPHSPAIQFSRHTDYDGYALQELEHRLAFKYPPYTHVVLVSARGKHETQAEFTLQTLYKRLEQGLPAGTIMGEPTPASLAKAHGQHRFQLLLRSEKIRVLCAHIKRVVDGLTVPADIYVSWDVDPMNVG